ncbi:uncharacterized protein LOC123197304 isoform X3 [Mangifera indica]|uniref:uncharacterized protein LOC123197304 isoform X3 n=1 Tax=Mangifera indica TaxID=29780 RepID=UPI001CF9D1AE|nr:uncharacterized protein LOC123197304 isoform X3 [Mangifera indica]
MAAAATASSIRYAPEDPSLPKPWKGLVDGRTGYLYFWNPETNVTQYQRPSNLAPPPRSSSVPISSSVQVEQSSEGQHRDCSPEKEDDRYGRRTIGGSKLDVGSRRNQSLRGAPIQSHNVPNGIASVRHGGLSMRGYGSSNAAVSLFPDAYCQQHKITVISKKRKKEKFGDRPRGHGKGDANCCARRMTQPAGAGSSKAVPFSLIVSDPELFDCPICLEPLTIPVFQCEDGHIVCSVCCGQLSVCPTCSLPVGYIRCRAIEKVLESVKVRCPNTKYGCNETMSYNLMSDHELTCQYMPCSCPLSDCNFIGTPAKLHQHKRKMLTFSFSTICLNLEGT